MRRTLVARVRHQPGVLSRVAGLFRRRAFNIDTLTVGGSEAPDMARMTIVVDTQRTPAALVAAMKRHQPSPALEFLIGLGADAVAAELAHD